MKRIAETSEILEDGINSVRSGSREFLITRRGDDVAVFGNLCPHHGADLKNGVVKEGVLTCPCHHARFDVKTGAPLSPPALDGITVYESAIDDGGVWVGKPFSAMSPSVGPKPRPRFVIVGAGAAGVSCAVTLRRNGFHGAITLISAEHRAPYDRTFLTKQYLSLGEAAPDFNLRDPAYYPFAGIELLLDDPVVTLDAKGGMVTCASGRVIKYDKLLLACGARPRRLGAPGEALGRVHHLRNVANADELKKSLEATESLLIAGAGFLGLEIAGFAAEIGKRVTVAAPEATPLSHIFGTDYAKRILTMMGKAGVVWLPGRTVRRFIGGRSVERIEMDNGVYVDAGAAVVAVGVRTETGIDGTESLEGPEGIRVGPRLQTDDPRIFAAGDVVAGPPTGHWVTAMRQGVEAASAMMGDEVPHEETPFLWTELFSDTVKMVGSASGNEPVVERGDMADGEFLAVWRIKGKVTGAFAVGCDRELIEVGNTL